MRGDHVLDLMIGEVPLGAVDPHRPGALHPGGGDNAGGPARHSRLRDRFGIPIRLEFYTPAELQKVLTQAAGKLGLDLHPEGFAGDRYSAPAARPRVAGRLLRRVRDFAASDGVGLIDRAAAASALARLDVDEVGLDALDRRYLRALIENYAGGPAGVETLAYAIAEARDAVEDVIEPFLLQQGFIQRTPRGRMACAKAYAHLGLTAPKTAGQPQPGDLFDDE